MLFALRRMRPAELARPELHARRRGALREALRYVARTPALAVPLAMMALVGTLAFNFQVLLPLLARFSFHGGPEAYATLVIAMGAGSVVGALVAGARGPGVGRAAHRLQRRIRALHAAGGAGAHPHAGRRGARPDGRGERDLRGGGELDPPARGGAGHARDA